MPKCAECGKWHLSLSSDGICKACKARSEREKSEKEYREAEEYYLLLEQKLQCGPLDTSHSGMPIDVLKSRYNACRELPGLLEKWDKYPAFDKVFRGHCQDKKDASWKENCLFRMYIIHDDSEIDYEQKFSQLVNDLRMSESNHRDALWYETVSISVEDAELYQEYLEPLYFCQSPFIRTPHITFKIGDRCFEVFASKYRVGTIYDNELVKRWSDFSEVEDFGLVRSSGICHLHLKAKFRRDL